MMRRNRLQILLVAIGIAAVMAGCADQFAPNASCAQRLPVASAAFPQLMTAQAGETLALNIKVHDAAKYINELRQSMVKVHGPHAGKLGKINIALINRELISLEIPKGSPAVEVIESEIASGKILFIEEDFRTFAIQPSLLETAVNAPLVDQWPLQNVQTYEAWKLTKGRKEIVVAVIDTGVDYTHKDLAANIWKNKKEVLNGLDDDHNGFVDDLQGWDFSQNKNDPMADDKGSYHGTHVAGTIAGTGGTGHAPNVTIMAIKYLDSSGSGSVSNAIRAIDYAVQNGAKILNNSWGSASYSQFLQDAIERAERAGVLVVAAAGNGDSLGRGIDIDRNPFYPAGYSNSNMITVAASNRMNTLTPWSNYGKKLVAVAAPGNAILSTRNGNTYATLSGTSMATPLVSGVLGLIWSMNPKLTAAEVKKILITSAEKESKLNSNVSTSGRVNAARAVQLAAKTLTGASVSDQLTLGPQPLCLK